MCVCDQKRSVPLVKTFEISDLVDRELEIVFLDMIFFISKKKKKEKKSFNKLFSYC